MSASDGIPAAGDGVREGGTPGEELPEHGVTDEGAIETPEGDRPLVSEPQAEAPVDVDALQEAAARASALAEKLQRVEAEFLNETRRIRRLAEEERKYAIEKVVVDLLPVVDALHSAREGLGDGEAADRMREGLDLVEKQLEGVFERYGVAAIEALGLPFDPARHQALMVVEHPDHEPQTVCEVMRPGYELKGRVVRPAEVIVVKAPVEAEPAAADASPETEPPASDED